MNQALNQTRTQLRSAWQGLAPRERQGLQLAGAALALLLVVAVGLRPAWHQLQQGPQQLADLDLRLQQMQALAAEAQLLRQAPAISPAQAEAALKAATEHLGPEAQLNIQGERATLRFSNLSGEALGRWLLEVRSAARARALEAQWQRGERGYGGSIVLVLGSRA